MSNLALSLQQRRERLGLKGPKAALWLADRGVALPEAPNTWTNSGPDSGTDALLVTRLGTAEYFLEDARAGTTLKEMAPALDAHPPGVYPVMREDWAFHLAGDRVHEVLAQVCNVNFAALTLDSRPVVMTLMIGVAVLIVPQCEAGDPQAAAGFRDMDGRRYRIWCDPTFGPYLGESLGAVVIECGGRYTGVSE
jgi:sarcosine oxidase, subunit gamma